MSNRAASYIKLYQKRLLEKGDPEQLVLNIMQFDPTPNGEYLEWLIKQYVNDLINFDQIISVKANLALYSKNKIRFDVLYRDINKFNYEGLTAFIDKQFKIINGETLIHSHVLHGDEKIIYSGILGELLIPLTQAASCRRGAGTKWCTSMEDDYTSWFEFYSVDGPLYVFIDRQRNSLKYQIHFETESFKDEQDELLDPELLSYYVYDHVLISLLFRDYEKRLLTASPINPEIIFRFAMMLPKRWKEAEQYLVDYDFRFIMVYLTKKIKGPWLELEQKLEREGRNNQLIMYWKIVSA